MQLTCRVNVDPGGCERGSSEGRAGGTLTAGIRRGERGEAHRAVKFSLRHVDKLTQQEVPTRERDCPSSLQLPQVHYGKSGNLCLPDLL